MSTEEKVTGQERRRSKRYAYDGQVTMCPPGGTPMIGDILDLSVDGCLLRVREGSPFQMESVALVSFQSDRLTVLRSGVVRRCEEQGGLLGIGFLQPGEIVSLNAVEKVSFNAKESLQIGLPLPS